MPYELLWYIFTMLSAFDRVINVSCVCKSWCLAAGDPRLTATLDIGEFRQSLKPNTPQRSVKRQLQLAFERGVKLSGLNLTTLAFDPSFQVTEKHLKNAYGRCTNLKNLVLPLSNSIGKPCLARAFRAWRDLESLQIMHHEILPPYNFLEMVHSYCANLGVLKISCRKFVPEFFKHIASYMPRLKVLCVRCVRFDATALGEELSRTKAIEEMYISTITIQSTGSLVLLDDIMAKANDARSSQGFPCIKVFHICNWIHCRNSCMASTMYDPPVHLWDLLQGIVVFGPN
ncbi:OLC1v1021211C2 [Oldenlandia corymbosa var. corymbosa]|nr:OLC1v1021211C2 [Oldenlandia corymbosa var. corymbosa]